jgi:Protein of unknown function (DUF3800)
MQPGDRKDNPHGKRPLQPLERYRLYLDESGDHVFRDFSNLAHRFLCLLGCWFKTEPYLRFQHALEELKAAHLPHHPDEPVVLHREDMLNARGAFKNLRDATKRADFDHDLIACIERADFRVVAVLIDKQTLVDAYGDTAAHPYHLALGFMLQRYAGYLNHIQRAGDVMAEARGGAEDRLLQDSYARVFKQGVWMTDAHVFQSALTSSQLKLKSKSANVAGLQLADLLGHPVKQWTLKRYGLIDDELAPFAQRLINVVEPKLNRHLYDGRVDGYGVVIYPKK